MKTVHIIIFCALMVFLLSGNAGAEPLEGQAAPKTSEENASPAAEENLGEEYAVVPPKTFEEQAEAMDAEGLKKALPREAREILGDISPTDINLGDEGFKSILDEIKGSFFSIFKSALKSAAKMLTVIILCSTVTSAMNEGGIRDMVTLSGKIAVSAIAISNVSSFLGMGMDTLLKLSDFSKALLPVMCTAAASAGAITSASAKYAATAMFMDVLITVAANIIMPLISIYLAAVIANAALSKDSLTNVSKLLKWVCTTSLTLLMTAFTTYLGFSGLISGKADEFATKLTKSALGTAMPVVGSIISDTAETLVAGAGMIRNAIGVFGFLAVAAICITPFLTLGAHYLVYKGTSALSEALTEKRMGELISDIGTAFGMLLGLVGAGSIMLFFSVISSMKAVNIL
ncbi:MAG: stage III sporulation protein AE [Oscillospiraceae bacterium]|jgi:stage III sporulation protein AE